METTSTTHGVSTFQFMQETCLNEPEGNTMPIQTILQDETRIECDDIDTESDNELDGSMYDSSFEHDEDDEKEGDVNDHITGDGENDEKNDNTDDDSSDEDDGFSDIEKDTEEPNVWDSDEDLDSGESSEDDDGRSKEKFPTFYEADLFNPKLEKGMRFRNKDLFREAVTSFAINEKRNLKITKSDKSRMHVKCDGRKKRKKRNRRRCPWYMHALKVPCEETFRIAKYHTEHRCDKTKKVKLLTSTWLGKRYQHVFVLNPETNIQAWIANIKRKLGYNISRQQAYRAKKYALDMLHGDPSEQYKLLWDFAEEVKRANPGSNVIILLDPNGSGTFDKMYMCLEPLKKGFKLGCRPIVGVDGCHLKGPHKGVLLTAVGVDPNNNIYPIAWAIVQKECIETWLWFMRLLESDLEMENHKDWTFISDKQKGLMHVFDTYFAEADKRFCLRHLLGNMRTAGFKGDAYKEALWNAGKASTIAQYQKRMEEIKNLDPKAFDWLFNRPAKNWSRSHFNTYPKCDMLLNNMCESYNKAILVARKMPVLSMMIWLIMHAMKRLQQNRDRCNKNWKGLVCPKIRKIMDQKMTHGSSIAHKSTDLLWLIEPSPNESYSVDLSKRTCGCRLWDLNGIPCKHVIAACSENDFDALDYVHEYYHVETYKKVYSVAIVPINGRSEWAKTGIEQPQPPNEGRTVGRPETLRRREKGEPTMKKKRKPRGKPPGLSKTNPDAMKRQQTTCRCSCCKEIGHNINGCAIYKASLASDSAEKPRPRKKQQVQTNKVSVSAPNTQQSSYKEQASMQSKGVTQITMETTPMFTYMQEHLLPAPSMNQQLVSSGNAPKNMSRTIRVDNATIHMRQGNTTHGVISRAQLEELRKSKKEEIKQGKKKIWKP